MSTLGGIDDEMLQETREDSSKKAKIEVLPKRKPFHYWKVGDREYKLKLTTGMIGKLENKYRSNILNVLTGGDGIPPLSVMLTVVQAAAAPWEHSTSYQEIQNLYDRWTEDGGNQMEFYSSVIIPTLAVSGFFTVKQAESILGNLKDMDELI